MNDIVMISIPKTTYDKLKKDSALLSALYAAGVDNWEGYNEVCGSDDEEYSEEV